MVLDTLGKWQPGMQQKAIEYDGTVGFIGTARQIAESVGHATTQPGQPGQIKDHRFLTQAQWLKSP